MGNNASELREEEAAKTDAVNPAPQEVPADTLKSENPIAPEIEGGNLHENARGGASDDPLKGKGTDAENQNSEKEQAKSPEVAAVPQEEKSNENQPAPSSKNKDDHENLIESHIKENPNLENEVPAKEEEETKIPTSGELPASDDPLPEENIDSKSDQHKVDEVQKEFVDMSNQHKGDKPTAETSVSKGKTIFSDANPESKLKRYSFVVESEASQDEKLNEETFDTKTGDETGSGSKTAESSIPDQANRVENDNSRVLVKPPESEPEAMLNAETPKAHKICTEPEENSIVLTEDTKLAENESENINRSHDSAKEEQIIPNTHEVCTEPEENSTVLTEDTKLVGKESETISRPHESAKEEMTTATDAPEPEAVAHHAQEVGTYLSQPAVPVVGSEAAPDTNDSFLGKGLGRPSTESNSDNVSIYGHLQKSPSFEFNLHTEQKMEEPNRTLGQYQDKKAIKCSSSEADLAIGNPTANDQQSHHQEQHGLISAEGKPVAYKRSVTERLKTSSLGFSKEEEEAHTTVALQKQKSLPAANKVKDEPVDSHGKEITTPTKGKDRRNNKPSFFSNCISCATGNV